MGRVVLLVLAACVTSLVSRFLRRAADGARFLPVLPSGMGLLGGGVVVLARQLGVLDLFGTLSKPRV